MGNIRRYETYSGLTTLPTEQQLASWIREQLPTLFPPTWALEFVPRAGLATASRPDLMFHLSDPNGAAAVVAVEIKRTPEPRDAASLVYQAKEYGAQGIKLLAVAPFMGPRLQDLLRENGISYIDATGNVWLRLDPLALYVDLHGAVKNPWPTKRSLHSLRGPAAGRIVRALCDFKQPYGVRVLAALSATTPGTVVKVLDLLEAATLIKRASHGKYRGPVLEVDWPQLIRQWVRDYSFDQSNTTSAYLDPRGLDVFFDKLKNTRQRYAVTGSFAGVQLAPVVQPGLATVYVEDIQRDAAAFALRSAERGTNVLLAEPFDPVVFERTWRKEGITYAAPAQITADLLTGPGRGPQEGAALLRWMEENEDAWRKQPIRGSATGAP